MTFLAAIVKVMAGLLMLATLLTALILTISREMELFEL
jgi:hypothetical protein